MIESRWYVQCWALVSRLGSDFMPSVSVDVTEVVNSSGWMDIQVFVCLDDVNVATETLMFAGSMKICGRYRLFPAMLNVILPFSEFLTLEYLMMDVR